MSESSARTVRVCCSPQKQLHYLEKIAYTNAKRKQPPTDAKNITHAPTLVVNKTLIDPSFDLACGTLSMARRSPLLLLTSCAPQGESGDLDS